MKMKFLIGTKLVLLLAVLFMGTLLSPSIANATVRPLYENELAKITGSWGYLCTPIGNACMTMSKACTEPGRNCAEPCEHAYQDWECKWYLYGTGCAPDPPRDCGSQDVGFCTENLECEAVETKGCGEATNCHNT